MVSDEFGLLCERKFFQVIGMVQASDGNSRVCKFVVVKPVSAIDYFEKPFQTVSLVDFDLVSRKLFRGWGLSGGHSDTYDLRFDLKAVSDSVGNRNGLHRFSKFLPDTDNS